MRNEGEIFVPTASKKPLCLWGGLGVASLSQTIISAKLSKLAIHVYNSKNNFLGKFNERIKL